MKTNQALLKIRWPNNGEHNGLVVFELRQGPKGTGEMLWSYAGERTIESMTAAKNELADWRRNNPDIEVIGKIE